MNLKIIFFNLLFFFNLDANPDIQNNYELLRQTYKNFEQLLISKNVSLNNITYLYVPKSATCPFIVIKTKMDELYYIFVNIKIKYAVEIKKISFD